MHMNMNPEVLSMLENIMESASAAGGAGSLLSIAAYVFSSLAIYTIAQRREIKNPWMAWVPLLNLWILGSISDQYRYVVMEQVKNKRKTLLILGIINLVLSIVSVVVSFVAIFSVVGASIQGASEQALVEMALSRIAVVLVAMLPMLVISIVTTVLEFFALYDLYASCEPENKVLYLVLSLIPGISKIARPLFLFLCRNKDDGMPPRRQETAEPVFEEPADYNYTQL